MVVDKQDARARKGIFMIDASAGFMKDGPKNRLRAQDIHKIVDVFNKRLEVPKYSRMVSVDEIEKNAFNLNLPRYIDSQTPEDIQDTRRSAPSSGICGNSSNRNSCGESDRRGADTGRLCSERVVESGCLRMLCSNNSNGRTIQRQQRVRGKRRGRIQLA